MEITDAQDRQIEIEYLASCIPRTIMAPFSSGNIIGVVLLALCTGATLRRLRGNTEQGRGVVHTFVRVIERVYSWLVHMLGWIILAVPLAVFGVVAQVVGKAGIGVFAVLWVFLVAMLVGLAIHALGYYPLVAVSMIVLPLVLSAAGLPPHVIGAAIPLIVTVDWIIARARSGVNVLSDMLVAILLDVGRITPATELISLQSQSEVTSPTEPQPSRGEDWFAGPANKTDQTNSLRRTSHAHPAFLALRAPQFII